MTDIWFPARTKIFPLATSFRVALNVQQTPCPIHNGVSFPGNAVALITHLHLVLKLRIHGVKHPRLPYIYMVWCWKKQRNCSTFYLSFLVAQQPKLGPGRLLLEVSRTHSDTPHSIGLLWTSDQPDAETSTWQHTKLTRDRQPYPQWDSNPWSQQASAEVPRLRPRSHWDRLTFLNISHEEMPLETLSAHTSNVQCNWFYYFARLNYAKFSFLCISCGVCVWTVSMSELNKSFLFGMRWGSGGGGVHSWG
jgi:hypothetical protein